MAYANIRLCDAVKLCMRECKCDLYFISTRQVAVATGDGSGPQPGAAGQSRQNAKGCVSNEAGERRASVLGSHGSALSMETAGSATSMGRGSVNSLIADSTMGEGVSGMQGWSGAGDDDADVGLPPLGGEEDDCHVRTLRDV